MTGLGLCGASGVGKSTIVDTLAESGKFNVIKSNAADIMKSMGFEMSKDMDFSKRLAFQEALLTWWEGTLTTQTGPFLTDRTPLDLAAYTIADCLKETGSEGERERVVKYVQKCKELTRKFYAVVCLVQPGIPYVEDPKRPPLNPAYQEHINHLTLGMIASHEMDQIARVIFPKELTDHKRRVDALREIWQGIADNISTGFSQLTKH